MLSRFWVIVVLMVAMTGCQSPDPVGTGTDDEALARLRIGAEYYATLGQIATQNPEVAESETHVIMLVQTIMITDTAYQWLLATEPETAQQVAVCGDAWDQFETGNLQTVSETMAACRQAVQEVEDE